MDGLRLSQLLARPVHLIITMMKWIRTSRLLIKKSLSQGTGGLMDGLRLSQLLAIFIERMTSDQKLKASREGSK